LAANLLGKCAVGREQHGGETDQVGTGTRDADAVQLLREHGRDIRASLASILATTDALRRADSDKLGRADRLPYLDAIWRDGSRVLDLMNRILTPSSPAAQDSPGRTAPAIQTPEVRATAIAVPPPARESSARGGTAYLGWLKSRLAQIETLGRDGARGDLASLANQLKDSAQTMGFAEISEAAAALQRLSETPDTPVDPGIEILRRVINRALRKTSGAAA
jgi:hypothetical protein